MTQSTISPQPGHVIGNKYRIERVLGQGGMGLVFEASHIVTAKRFAIKWLLHDRTNNDGAVARFVREAQVAGRCEHRNIVEVYDIDREGDAMFMVMELLKGESLAERLARGGALPPSDACRLLLPCIEAVGEAHAAGIIHRDLKPANIFICQARGREPELAKVLDFGVSRFTSNHEIPLSVKTKDGTVIGTPFYMSPEQMRSQPIDHRVDVYSMGVTLYEVLSGVRPYNAPSYGDLLLKVADANPIPLHDLVPGLPSALEKIVEKAMAFERDDRFADMREFASALEAFARSAHVAGRTLLAGSGAGATLSADTPWVSESSAFGLEGAAAVKPRTAWRWIAVAGAAALLAASVYLWNFRGTPAEDAQATPRAGSQPVSAGAANAIAQSPAAPIAPPALRPDAGTVEAAAASDPVAAPVTTPEPGPTAPTSHVPQPSHARRSGSRAWRVRTEEAAGEAAPSRDGSGDANSSSPPPRTHVKNRAHATMERSEF